MVSGFLSRSKKLTAAQIRKTSYHQTQHFNNVQKHFRITFRNDISKIALFCFSLSNWLFIRYNDINLKIKCYQSIEDCKLVYKIDYKYYQLICNVGTYVCIPSIKSILWLCKYFNHWILLPQFNVKLFIILSFHIKHTPFSKYLKKS